MLNSVMEKDLALPRDTVHPDASRVLGSAAGSAEGVRGARPRVRMSKDDRRRQLVGIGLQFLTSRPIQDVSLDEVAREAGISRGLLFHYFPTKTAFYEGVVAAAGRRIARTVKPDDGVSGHEAVGQFLERYVAQIERRRELYLSLVHGSLAELGGVEVAGTLRQVLSARVVTAMAQEGVQINPAVAHAWVAYVEDLTVAWTGIETEGRSFDSHALCDHCLRTLSALAAIPLGREGGGSPGSSTSNRDASRLKVAMEVAHPSHRIEIAHGANAVDSAAVHDLGATDKPVRSKVAGAQNDASQRADTNDTDTHMFAEKGNAHASRTH